MDGTVTSPAATAEVPARADGLHRIVVVGGGAGGLELGTRLGDRLGKHRKALVSLVDARAPICGSHCCIKSPPAAWISATRLDYMAQARWHHFRSRLGGMNGLDRAPRVAGAPLDEAGEQATPERRFHL